MVVKIQDYADGCEDFYTLPFRRRNILTFQDQCQVATHSVASLLFLVVFLFFLSFCFLQKKRVPSDSQKHLFCIKKERKKRHTAAQERIAAAAEKYKKKKKLRGLTVAISLYQAVVSTSITDSVRRDF